jgi:hypothetical protein
MEEIHITTTIIVRTLASKAHDIIKIEFKKGE